MNWLSIVTSVLGFTLQSVNESQDRKELRNAIRQRILAPNVHRLNDPVVLEEVAASLVQAAYGINSTNILGAFIVTLLMRTIRADKIALMTEILDDHKTQLMSLRTKRHDDATWDFVSEDKDEAKDFIRDVLALL